MVENNDNSTFGQPNSIADIILYLKEKIKASREKAQTLFLAFMNQAALATAPGLRSVLNRIRDELRSVNPQPALAIQHDPLTQMRFIARIHAERNERG